MAYNKLSLIEKLLSKATQVGDCLIWHGQKCVNGYGRLRLNGKLKRAHRLMYEYHHGTIPDGLNIIHSCDTPACIAIKHLSADTQLENIQDMHNKGRAKLLHGEENHKSKLTRSQVTEIRIRYKPYDRTNGTKALGREYGVSHAAISAIVNGKSWAVK